MITREQAIRIGTPTANAKKTIRDLISGIEYVRMDSDEILDFLTTIIEGERYDAVTTYMKEVRRYGEG